MPQPNDLSRSLVALDQNSTIIAVIEMSQSSWLVAGVLPGIERQPRKKLEPNAEGLLGLLHRWRDEAIRAGKEITRIGGLRIPAGEIEQLVSNRVRRWLLDPGSVYFGKLDVLVNNAGISGSAEQDFYSTEAWHRIMIRARVEVAGGIGNLPAQYLKETRIEDGAVRGVVGIEGGVVSGC
jgi:hypothetical protein